MRTAGGPRTIMLGRAIDRNLLAPVENSLGVLFHVQTKTASGASPRRAGSLQEEGTRTIAKPLKLTDPDGASAQLLVSMSSRRVAAATWSILMVTGGAGVLVLMLLLGFLQALLGKSVISPVRGLTRGIERVRAGQHATRVSVEGAEELRFLAEGFNEMTATVGAQHQRLEHLAATDHLTGVANHRRFHDALGHAVAAAELAAPRLRSSPSTSTTSRRFNDAHGHAYGDDVLRLVGARLTRGRPRQRPRRPRGRRGVRAAPARSRRGGRGADSGAGAGRRREHRPDGRRTLGCSAGLAVFPDDTLRGRELLSLADAALYLAKNAGRGQTRRFDASQVTVLSPDQQRDAVRSVLSNPEHIIPVFQPIVSLAEGGSSDTRRSPASTIPPTALPTSGSPWRGCAAWEPSCRR